MESLLPATINGLLQQNLPGGDMGLLTLGRSPYVLVRLLARREGRHDEAKSNFQRTWLRPAHCVLSIRPSNCRGGAGLRSAYRGYRTGRKTPGGNRFGESRIGR